MADTTVVEKPTKALTVDKVLDIFQNTGIITATKEARENGIAPTKIKVYGTQLMVDYPGIRDHDDLATTKYNIEYLAQVVLGHTPKITELGKKLKQLETDIDVLDRSLANKDQTITRLSVDLQNADRHVARLEKRMRDLLRLVHTQNEIITNWSDC